MNLYLDDFAVCLPSDFEFSVDYTNPLCERTGSFSLSVSVPVQGNEMLFGSPSEGLFSTIKFKARLFQDGFLLFLGEAVVNELKTKEVSITLLFGMSEINKILLEKKPLSELELGEMPNLSYSAINAQSMREYIDITYSDSHPVCYPPCMSGSRFYNPLEVSLLHHPDSSQYCIAQTRKERLQERAFASSEFIPMPFVGFVLTRAFEALGFSLDQKLLKEHPLLSRLFFVFPKSLSKLQDGFSGLTLLDIVSDIERICSLILLQNGNRVVFVPVSRYLEKVADIPASAIQSETYVEQIDKPTYPQMLRPFRYNMSSRGEEVFYELNDIDRKDDLFNRYYQELYDSLREENKVINSGIDERLIHKAQAHSNKFKFIARKIDKMFYPCPVDRFHPFSFEEDAEALSLRPGIVKALQARVYANPHNILTSLFIRTLVPILQLDSSEAPSSASSVYGQTMEESFLKGERDKKRHLYSTSRIALLADFKTERLASSSGSIEFHFSGVYSDFVHYFSLLQYNESDVDELPDLTLNNETYPPNIFRKELQLDYTTRVKLSIDRRYLTDDTYIYSLNGRRMFLQSRTEKFNSFSENRYTDCIFIPIVPS